MDSWAVTIVLNDSVEERQFTTLYEAACYIFNAERYNLFKVDEIITPEGENVKVYGDRLGEYRDEFVSVLKRDELAISYFRASKDGVLWTGGGW